MAFKYEATVQHGEDTTEYVNLGKEGVSVAEFEGKKILKIAPEALTKIAQAAFEEVEFCLRPAHTAKVAKILQDPEASCLRIRRRKRLPCRGSRIRWYLHRVGR